MSVPPTCRCSTPTSAAWRKAAASCSRGATLRVSAEPVVDTPRRPPSPRPSLPPRPRAVPLLVRGRGGLAALVTALERPHRVLVGLLLCSKGLPQFFAMQQGPVGAVVVEFARVAQAQVLAARLVEVR